MDAKFEIKDDKKKGIFIRDQRLYQKVGYKKKKQKKKKSMKFKSGKNILLTKPLQKKV